MITVPGEGTLPGNARIITHEGKGQKAIVGILNNKKLNRRSISDGVLLNLLNSAISQHQYPIAQSCQLGIMRGQNNYRPAFSSIFNQGFTDLFADNPIEIPGGFVRQDQKRQSN
jgi:hypothetical protein